MPRGSASKKTALASEQERPDVARKRARWYLHAWETGSQARAGVGRWITFYNHLRPHAAHGGRTPAMVYFNSIENDQQVQAVA